MTEQKETEEPCEFKFFLTITLCHVFRIIRISGLCQPRTLPWNLCSRQDASHVSSVDVCWSSMKGLKTTLRSATSDARLTSLSMKHAHKHKEIDLNEVISELAGKEDRRLALCL